MVIGAVAALLVVGSLATARGGLFSGTKQKSPERPAATVKTGDVNAVAPEDSPLLRVTKPPANTRERISLKRDIGDARFSAEFEPYGTGPLAGTLVIKTGSVKAEGGTDLASKFAESLQQQNMIVRVQASEVGTVRTGGPYTGTITLEKDGDASIFMLSSVEKREGE